MVSTKDVSTSKQIYTVYVYMYDSKNDMNKRYICHGKKFNKKNTVFTVDQPKRQIKEIIVEQQQQQQQQTKSII